MLSKLAYPMNMFVSSMRLHKTKGRNFPKALPELGFGLATGIVGGRLNNPYPVNSNCSVTVILFRL